MVNLVIVSHCHGLAEGVKELAEQLAGGKVRIAAAGGVLDGDRPPRLGTDATRIAKAVEAVWSPEGVLLLVDLGSAVLSAELALEMLPATLAERCLISNAPLVEGAVVAALEASIDHPLKEVNQAAELAGSVAKVAR